MCSMTISFTQLLETPDNNLTYFVEARILNDSTEFIYPAGSSSDSILRSNEVPFKEHPEKKESITPFLQVKRDTI